MIGSWVDPEFEREVFSGSEIKHMFMDQRGKIQVTGAGLSEPERSYLGDVRKVVIPVHQAYFHIITETLVEVVSAMKEADQRGEKIQIILISNSAGVPGNENSDTNHIFNMLDHIVKQIEGAGHSAVIGAFSNGAHTAINNFEIYQRVRRVSLKSMKSVSEFLSRGVEAGDATRKIYLTRKKTLSNSTYRVSNEEYESLTLDEIRNKYQYKINSRVDDELAVEEYFAILGFEVVCPEDIKQYEDQIRLMTEARIVVSLTSAGLTSLIYMKPQGAIVELLTPLVTGHREEDESSRSIHPHYYNLSQEFGLTYTSIGHSRSATEIISKIETTPGLKKYLSA